MTTPLLTPERQAYMKAIDWQLMRDNLDWLNRLAMDDLLKVIRAAQLLPSNVDAKEYILQAMHDLVLTYGGTVEDLTVEWWNLLVEDERFFATPPRVDAYEQLTKQVRWGVAPMFTGNGDMTTRLAGVLQRHIFGAQRDTVDILARQWKVGYARIAREDACAFCRILAGRGAVYGSVGRAQYVGMGGVETHYVDGSERGTRMKRGRVRGTQKAGQKYHDHCKCITAPLIPGKSLEYPDHQDRFDEQYLTALDLVEERGQPRSMVYVTRAMREIFPDVR